MSGGTILWLIILAITFITDLRSGYYFWTCAAVLGALIIFARYLPKREAIERVKSADAVPQPRDGTQAPSELAQRRAAVLRTTRANYCHSRQDVKAEVIARQAALLTPAQTPAGGETEVQLASSSGRTPLPAPWG